jgi:Tfp pilus assembly protein PilF
MLMPAMLLVAILGPSPYDPAASAPATQEPTTQEPAASPASSASSAGSASDEIQAGLEAFRRRRFTQARAAFERAVASDPQSAAAHFYLGYTIYKIAEPKRHDSPGKKEAAEHFARAYELDPNFKPAWGSRG